MDAARAAKRLGYEDVSIVYRRKNQRRASCQKKMEIEHAEKEGIKFIELLQPIEIIGKDGAVSKSQI